MAILTQLFTMEPHAIILLLKKGLKKLWDQTQDRKVALEAALKANQPISDADEEWLDYGAGNLVDEERLVDELEKASDYDNALKNLGQQDQAIVQKLTELAEGTIAPSKKCKCMLDSESQTRF
ncbi:hypothetical protein J3R83DRAFT_9638 [Lanmaoa asiatica]|nr:hypothetical protein J3R83DRAFT_9638 [Lanmaoa asiatica]